MSSESEVQSQVVEVLKGLGVKLLETQTKTDKLREKYDSYVSDSDGETAAVLRSLVMDQNGLVTDAFETALVELPSGNFVFPHLGNLMAEYGQRKCDLCSPPKGRECTECEKCVEFCFNANGYLEYYYCSGYGVENGAEVRFGYPDGYDVEWNYFLLEGYVKSFKDNTHKFHLSFSVKPVGEDRWLVDCNRQTQEFSTVSLDEGLTSMLKVKLLAL